MANGVVELKPEDRKVFDDLLESIRKMPAPASTQVAPAAQDVAPEATEEQEHTGEGEEAEMGARFGLSSLNVIGKTAEKLDKMMWGVPVGSVVVGLVPAMVVGEVVDGFVPPSTSSGSINWLNVGARAVGAGVMVSRPVKRVIGPTASVIAAAVLIAPPIARMLPLDKAVNWVVTKIGRKGAAHSNVLSQAQEILNQGPISGGTQYPGML